MYYAVHNGRRKPPLHLMTAHAVYDVCKSRELITALNRIGTCVSYNEIKRTRSSLAQYALHRWGWVLQPFPCHFVSDSFTIAAFDNFDHCDRLSPSGTESNHDTVMTLFQIKPIQTSSKPSKSSVQLQLSDTSTLSCQQIKPFISKKDNVLLDSFTVSNQLFTADRSLVAAITCRLSSVV